MTFKAWWENDYRFIYEGGFPREAAQEAWNAALEAAAQRVGNEGEQLGWAHAMWLSDAIRALKD